MSTIATETGDLAADSVAEILAGAGNDVESQLAAAKWALGKFAEGGWTSLTASDSDADLTLRDIQQIARVAGRYAVPHALTTTLLAGRWFPLDERELADGVTFALADGDAALLPYAIAGTRMLDADGEASAVVAEIDDGFSLLAPIAPASDAVITGARAGEAYAAFAAVATGCADAVVDRSVDWVQTREQFGRPLKAFQALRHHLADMHIAREESWTCAIAAGQDPDQAARWAWLGLQRAKTVIETGIQVHGGIGFTWEAGIHHWLRQVLQLEVLVPRA